MRNVTYSDVTESWVVLNQLDGPRNRDPSRYTKPVGHLTNGYTVFGS